VWFGILGEVVARRADGTAVALGGPKVRTLLVLLLAEAGRTVSTEKLIDGIYGSEPPEGAANALQAQVSRLRKSLGANLVERHPHGYRLAIDPRDVDAHQFETLIDEGEPGAALELWRGAPPVELGEAAIARLEELRLVAIEEDTEAQLRQGTASVPRLQELVSRHPLRERLRGQLMRALAATGRQAEALTAFEEARRTLADELGADPSAELADTHVAILKSETVTANPVPAQLTSFVGRDGDKNCVTELLARHRLVTLTGPGGAGKTRLAVEAARAERSVCFVELADAEDVPQAVLGALGLRDTKSSWTPVPPIDRLAAALKDQPILIVLDNCEHVIDDAAHLAARLLARRPEVRILATSREPLGITGEALYPVPRLTTAPAVQLFTDRAKAVRGDFAVTDEVRHICEALDGLPLAIELAAARVRSLGVTEIANRLDDRFGLLSKGSRTAEARHRTLRAVVEWSWDLLEPEEQALASRLTVFAGGATLADAREVCGLPDDLMTELVDKSLVEVSGDRYRMLETIRAFCAERLGDETTRTRRRHAEHFLHFAHQATSHLLSAEQLQWLDRMESEHDNLHAALRWAVESDQGLALELVGAMSTYWWMRGRRFEGAELCFALAEDLGPSHEMSDEFALCITNALAAKGDGPLRDFLRVLRAWGVKRNAPPRHPFVTIVVAPVVGPPPLENAMNLIGPDPWSQALAPLGRSFVEVFAGDVNSAYRSLREALAGFRVIGERWGMMQTITELAVIVSWRGDHSGAIAMLDEAIGFVRELGSTDELSEMIVRRADCLLKTGDIVAAEADYRRVETLANRLATPGLLVGAHLGLARIARYQGDFAESRRLCLLALNECGSGWFGPDWVRPQVYVALGWLACAEGKPDEAKDWLRKATELATHWDNGPLRAAATEATAAVALLDNNPTQAAQLLGTATRLRGMAIAGDIDVANVSTTATQLIGPKSFGTNYTRGLRT
jgi:predicted ATPase/DNA-binding SARP family transcriptional activator